MAFLNSDLGLYNRTLAGFLYLSLREADMDWLRTFAKSMRFGNKVLWPSSSFGTPAADFWWKDGGLLVDVDLRPLSMVSRLAQASFRS